MPIDARPTLAEPDDDPYLWLEDVDGPRALQWVDAQTAETLRRFGSERFARDRDVLTALFDRPDRIPGITRRGGAIYNYWQDAANPKGLWRRTTLASYREADPSWEVLLDLDALAKAEGEDWIWAGASTLPPVHDRAILRLSRGGGDAVVLREFDIPSKRFVEDGFGLPEAKGGASWLDRDTLLVSSAFGVGMATRSGYARTVRLWRRGEDFEKAAILFETQFEKLSVDGSLDRTSTEKRLVFTDHHSFFEHDDWFGPDARALTRLEVPSRSVEIDPRRLAAGEAAEPLDDRRGELAARHVAGHRAFALHRRARATFPSCSRRPSGARCRAIPGAVRSSWLPSSTNCAANSSSSRRGTPAGRADSVAGLPEIGVVDVSPLDKFDEESNGEALVSFRTR